MTFGLTRNVIGCSAKVACEERDNQDYYYTENTCRLVSNNNGNGNDNDNDNKARSTS